MKRHFKIMLSVALCIASLLCFSACQQDVNTETEADTWCETYDAEIINSDPDNVSYDYIFNNVEELQLAIKKSPDKYNGAKVKVVGTINKRDNVTKLIDLVINSQNVGIINSHDSGLLKYEFRQMLDSADWNIEIIITNDAQYSVAESGDLVKLYGTVNITRDKVSINHCEYELIAALDERVKK